MRSRFILLSMVVGILLAMGGTAQADLLVRMDESTLKGTFKGGTDAAVLFETGGKVQQISASDVFCLLFSPRQGAPSPGAGSASGSGPFVLLKANGQTLRGSFKGGTDAAILFETGGQVAQIAIAEVRTIVNEKQAAPAAAAAPAAVAPVAAAPAATAPGSGIAPAGTKLLVALTENVTTASHAKGAVVGGVLATPLSVNGTLLAPEGTKVFGKVSESRGGKAVGGAYIIFSFTGIQIGDQVVPIETTDVGAESGKGGTAKKVGAGALIGAAAGDAGAGAAVGGAVALLSSRGNHVQIAKGTKAEVALKTDLKIGG